MVRFTSNKQFFQSESSYNFQSQKQKQFSRCILENHFRIYLDDIDVSGVTLPISSKSLNTRVTKDLKTGKCVWQRLERLLKFEKGHFCNKNKNYLIANSLFKNVMLLCEVFMINYAPVLYVCLFMDLKIDGFHSNLYVSLKNCFFTRFTIFFVGGIL